MGFLIWVIAGAVVGAIFTILAQTLSWRTVMFGVFVGVIGALLAGFLSVPLLGLKEVNPNEFSLPNMGVGLLGASMLAGAFNLIMLIKRWHDAELDNME